MCYESVVRTGTPASSCKWCGSARHGVIGWLATQRGPWGPEHVAKVAVYGR